MQNGVTAAVTNQLPNFRCSAPNVYRAAVHAAISFSLCLLDVCHIHNIPWFSMDEPEQVDSETWSPLIAIQNAHN